MKELPALYSIGFLPYFIQKAIIKGVQVLYQIEVFGIIWDVDASHYYWKYISKEREHV